MSSGSSQSENPPGAASASRADLTARLESLWQLLDSGVLADAPKIFQEASLVLARGGGPDSARQVRELSAQIAYLVPAYRRAVRGQFERSLPAFLDSQAGASSAKTPLGLSLMAMDESDVAGQVEQASARLRDLVQESWGDVARRLQTLVGRDVPETEQPLRPAILVQALADGLGVDLGRDVLAGFVRSLPAALAPSLTTAYKSIGQRLAEQGVEPRAAVRVAPVLRATPTTIHRELPARLEATLLEAEREAALARGRKPPVVRPEVPAQEIPELQPDPWGLAEYVRLQAQFGVHARALFDAAMGEGRDEPERPAKALRSAMNAAQKLDLGVAEALGATDAEAAPAAQRMDTREYSKRLIGLADIPLHKHIVQLAARIFARIERDRIVAPTLRSLIVALRFPFLEAALADPSVFLRPEHPARALINAIATASIEWNPQSPAGGRLLQQAKAAVLLVLGAPGSAEETFRQARSQFQSALSAPSAEGAEGARLAAAREALVAAEEREARALDVGAFLGEVLAPATLDAPLRQFLVRDWARVIVQVGLDEAAVAGGLRRVLAVVPDLVWSLQPGVGEVDRKRLVEQGPAMLETLRDGVASIGWSGSRLKELVEQLREAQSRALGDTAPRPAGAEGFSVSTVRIRLDGLRLETLPSVVRHRPFPVIEEAVHLGFEKGGQGIAHRRVQEDKAPPAGALEPARAEQIIERWRPSSWFDLRIGRAAIRVRLEAFTPTRSLALFSTPPGPALYSLSHTSLVTYVRNQWMTPVEAVPLVARAFRTVLSDLRRAAQSPPEGGGHAS